MDYFVYDLSILLVVSAFFAYLSVLLKQPIIVGYIFCGVLIGPWGLKVIKDLNFIEAVSHLGITLLLFLAGLCLHPQKLIGLFKKTTFVTLINCLFSFLLAFIFAQVFSFDLVDSMCIAMAMMFSSTILCVKLMPTTSLHQQRMGAVCISILIFQDLLAIIVLAFVRGMSIEFGNDLSFHILLIKLAIFMAVLFLLDHFVLIKIMRHVERRHEMLFVLGLAWCFGLASVSNQVGLFYETGAFFAGVAIARHPISFFISESLKPIRDFFLVLFFFTLGAKVDLFSIKEIIVPAMILAALFVFLKPLVFFLAFLRNGEERSFSKETSMRLGQLSEFSLLIALLAFEMKHISQRAFLLIQLTAILTLILSSYLVVYRYPTPIGTSDELIRD